MCQIAWIAGIIDGEGCIYGKSLKPGHTTVMLKLDVQSVSKRMIDELETFFIMQGVEYKRLPTVMQKLSTRPAERIVVWKKRSLLKLLTILSRYLVVKKPEALRVMEFLSKSCKVKKYFATAADLTIIDDLKRLKREA